MSRLLLLVLLAASPLTAGLFGSADATSIRGKIVCTTSPTDTYALTYNAGTGKVCWAAPSGITSSSQVIALWSGTCNSGSVLGGDGSCKVVSSAFSAVTAGTNLAALLMGSGGSLDVTGSGTINATHLAGLAAAANWARLNSSNTFSADATWLSNSISASTIIGTAGGNAWLTIGNGTVAVKNSQQFNWSSTAAAGGTPDLGMGRNAAGVAEINTGTAGRFQDIKLRHLVGGAVATYAPAPTIASGFGTSPSIAGSDIAGRITVGTGGSDTNGVITFGTSWATAPACIAVNETQNLAVRATATATTLTLTSPSAFTAADKLVWNCIGY